MNRTAIQEHRDLLKTLITQTSRCDGSSTLAVRLWLREIELAFNQVGQQNIIQVVTNTVIDNFRFETERFFAQFMRDNNVTRDAVPWPRVRDHLSYQCFNTDEMQSLNTDACNKQLQEEPEWSSGKRAGFDGRRYVSLLDGAR